MKSAMFALSMGLASASLSRELRLIGEVDIDSVKVRSFYLPLMLFLHTIFSSFFLNSLTKEFKNLFCMRNHF